jgi:hypothetical protein
MVAFMPGAMGGMETYCRDLLQALQEVDQGNTYSLICDDRFIKEIPINNPKFSAISCNYAKPSIMWFLRGSIRNTINIDILTRFMNRLQVDVLHHPFSFLNPLNTKIPSV